MPNKDIIVIGASMGGIEALKTLVSSLPRDLKATLFVVQHTSPQSPGILHQILAHAGNLPSLSARDWDEIRQGHIYVASPDHHLLVDRSGYVRVTRGPKENRTRPAIDPLFRSAAHAFGPRVIGVILTGWLDDGTSGLWAIKEGGGTAVVQHPEDAIAPSMPLSALKHVEVDYCVPLKEIGPLLVRLAGMRADEKGGHNMPKSLETEINIAKEDKAVESGISQLGEPSLFACPECHGVLLELKEGSGIRFRCHTGHAYSVEALLAECAEKTEESLWNAVRALEETALLLQRMASRLIEHNHKDEAGILVAKARESQNRADLVRRALMKDEEVKARKPSALPEQK